MFAQYSIIFMNPNICNEKKIFQKKKHINNINSYLIFHCLFKKYCKMNTRQRRSQMDTFGETIYIGSVFIAGLLSFFSPCIFPLLPVYMGVLTEDAGKTSFTIGSKTIYMKPIVKTLCFIFGLSTVFITLGYGASLLGNILYHPTLPIVMGILVIILGLHQAEFIQLAPLQKQKSLQVSTSKNGYLSSFLLGFGFSFGWTPCIGPVLSAILALSASGGQNQFIGAWFMFVYTVGLSLPFLILSFTSSLLMTYFVKIKIHMLTLKRIGGILIILMGILLMFGQLNQITALFS